MYHFATLHTQYRHPLILFDQTILLEYLTMHGEVNIDSWLYILVLLDYTCVFPLVFACFCPFCVFCFGFY